MSDSHCSPRGGEHASGRRKVGEKEEHFLLSRGGLQHRRVTTFCFHSTVTAHDRSSVSRDLTDRSISG